MDNLALKYNYHDSNVDKVEIGPRRELKLKIQLDPIMNKGKERFVNLSFRAVDNLDIVKNFVEKYLETRPTPNAFLGRIDELKKSTRNDYVIDFDNVGQLTVKCKGHVETSDASA
jgi:hypothetical protein